MEGDEAGAAAEPSLGLECQSKAQRGACDSQMNWAGPEVDAGTKHDYEASPRPRLGCLVNVPSVLRRTPEPREGKRLPSLPQHLCGRASSDSYPPGLGKPGHLENLC